MDTTESVELESRSVDVSDCSTENYFSDEDQQQIICSIRFTTKGEGST